MFYRLLKRISIYGIAHSIDFSFLYDLASILEFIRIWKRFCENSFLFREVLNLLILQILLMYGLYFPNKLRC